MTTRAPNHLPAWQALLSHHSRIASLHMRRLFADDAERARRFSLEACDLFLDYSKNRINAQTMELLFELARQADVEAWRECMYAGDAINTSEGRAALHVALRHPGDAPFPHADRDVMPQVLAARRRMREISDALRAGTRLGHSGKPITSVVHIGIGGSHLGMEMAVQALAAREAGRPAVRFVSSVDAANLAGALQGLDAETTLFIVASKTFSTAETMLNAASAAQWQRAGSGRDAIAGQFIAVTANDDAARAFGVAAEDILPVWDWVGGRYSLTSAMALPVAVAAGMDAFEALLAGAHAMDRHFHEAPLEQNMPVVLGLLGVWYRNFFAARGAHASPGHDDTLLANALAQAEALMGGREAAETRARLEGQGLGGPALKARLPHCVFAGNQPSNTLLYERLTPRTLGALVALYEHRLFVQSVCWGVNAFDQWGVELGKELAQGIVAELAGGGVGSHDGSTAALLERARRMRSKS